MHTWPSLEIRRRIGAGFTWSLIVIRNGFEQMGTAYSLIRLGLASSKGPVRFSGRIASLRLGVPVSFPVPFFVSSSFLAFQESVLQSSENFTKIMVAAMRSVSRRMPHDVEALPTQAPGTVEFVPVQGGGSRHSGQEPEHMFALLSEPHSATAPAQRHKVGTRSRRSRVRMTSGPQPSSEASSRRCLGTGLALGECGAQMGALGKGGLRGLS